MGKVTVDKVSTGSSPLTKEGGYSFDITANADMSPEVKQYVKDHPEVLDSIFKGDVAGDIIDKTTGTLANLFNMGMEGAKFGLAATAMGNDYDLKTKMITLATAQLADQKEIQKDAIAAQKDIATAAIDYQKQHSLDVKEVQIAAVQANADVSKEAIKYQSLSQQVMAPRPFGTPKLVG